MKKTNGITIDNSVCWKINYILESRERYDDCYKKQIIICIELFIWIFE
jgi:hypothetical protein